MVPMIIAACLFGALGVGLVANRWVRPFAKTESHGVKLEALVAPIMSLAVVIVAFVLVQTFTSYVKAGESAGDEAGQTDYLFDVARLAPDHDAIALQAATVCYARSIAFLEWPLLTKERTAHGVSTWTHEMDAVYLRLAREGGKGPFSTILATDKERGEARRRRLTGARPAIPTELTALMLAASGLGLLALATFTLPNVRRRVQVLSITGLATMLVLVQIVIADIDRPYSGMIKIGPVDMVRTAGSLGDDFGETWPGAKLPCDAMGRRITQSVPQVPATRRS